MTEDIWKEKPTLFVEELEHEGIVYFGDMTFTTENEVEFIKEIGKFNAWLAKLKVHYNRLEGIMSSLEDMGVLNVYDIKHWSTDYAEQKEKYQRAVEALKEISLGRGPYKMDPYEHAVSCINSMKQEALVTLVEIGEMDEVEG